MLPVDSRDGGAGGLPRELELERLALFDLPLPPPQPTRGVNVADEARRQCSKCGKNLRPYNKTDTCARCKGTSVAKKQAPVEADDAVLDRVNVAKKTPPKPDALKRFRTVAEALGYDPDELLATYCEDWLLAVKQGVDKLEGGGE